MVWPAAEYFVDVFFSGNHESYRTRPASLLGSLAECTWPGFTFAKLAILPDEFAASSFYRRGQSEILQSVHQAHEPVNSNIVL